VGKVDLSILIPVYNCWDLTQACLESLREHPPALEFEVIIVDDGSTDETRTELAKLVAPYRIFCNEENRGFSANNNFAAKEALGEVLCLLNNDTELTPGWWEPLWETLHLAPRAGVVGNIQFRSSTGEVDHAGVYISNTLEMLHWRKIPETAPGDRWLEWPCVTAACCLIRRDLFFQVGQFDTTYRNGYEDMDLCLKAWKAGYRNYVALESRIFHHVSSSPGRSDHNQPNFWHYQDRWLPVLRLLRHPYNPVFQSVSYFKNRPLWKGCWRERLYHLWNLRLLPESRPPWIWPTFEEQPGLDTILEDYRRGGGRSLFINVSHSASTLQNTGIQRVVRSLTAALQEQIRIEYVEWPGGADGFIPLRKERRLLLSLFNGPAIPPAEQNRSRFQDYSLRRILELRPPWQRPLHERPGFRDENAGAWLLLPELMTAARALQQIQYARNQGLRVAAIFYDDIPLQRPEWTSTSIRNEHAGYMTALSNVDVLIPISEDSARAFQAFVVQNGLPMPRIQPCELAGELLGQKRRVSFPPMPRKEGPMHVLCVGTLERRKNHEGLLRALAEVERQAPGLDWHLTFCGGEYSGQPEIVQSLKEACRTNPRLNWLGQVSDDQLAELYAHSDFTVFPSLLEGFGLPILESLWEGAPCLCSDSGAIAETAQGGGCWLVDVSDYQALAEGFLRLLREPELRQKLRDEACSRPIKTWTQYATEVLETLRAKTIPPLQR
jgi:GT2 family glycosyltransferase